MLGLAGVAADRSALPPSIDIDHDVDVTHAAPDEAGAELGVELGGDWVWQNPGEDRHTGRCRCSERGLGGATMVRVSGDSALVEGEQQVGSGERVVDHVHEALEWDFLQVPVGIVEQLDVVHPEYVGGRGQLVGA